MEYTFHEIKDLKEVQNMGDFLHRTDMCYIK